MSKFGMDVNGVELAPESMGTHIPLASPRIVPGGEPIEYQGVSTVVRMGATQDSISIATIDARAIEMFISGGIRHYTQAMVLRPKFSMLRTRNDPGGSHVTGVTSSVIDRHSFVVLELGNESASMGTVQIWKSLVRQIRECARQNEISRAYVPSFIPIVARSQGGTRLAPITAYSMETSLELMMLMIFNRNQIGLTLGNFVEITGNQRAVSFAPIVPRPWPWSSTPRLT